MCLSAGTVLSDCMVVSSGAVAAIASLLLASFKSCAMQARSASFVLWSRLRLARTMSSGRQLVSVTVGLVIV